MNLPGHHVKLIEGLGDIGILLRGALHNDRIAYRISYDARRRFGGRTGSLAASRTERAHARRGFIRALLESLFLKRCRPSAAPPPLPCRDPKCLARFLQPPPTYPEGSSAV